jgi:hypothetical protein
MWPMHAYIARSWAAAGSEHENGQPTRVERRTATASGQGLAFDGPVLSLSAVAATPGPTTGGNYRRVETGGSSVTTPELALSRRLGCSSGPRP